MIQLLAQGPFTQQQIVGLSDEEKKETLPQLLQYAQKTVDSLQQQRYPWSMPVRQQGKFKSYPDLYRDYVSSDLSAIQLDQKVTATALADWRIRGEFCSGFAAPGAVCSFSAGCTGDDPRKRLSSMPEGQVAQVQAIQALQMGGSQQLPLSRQELRSLNLSRWQGITHRVHFLQVDGSAIASLSSFTPLAHSRLAPRMTSWARPVAST